MRSTTGDLTDGEVERSAMDQMCSGTGGVEHQCEQVEVNREEQIEKGI
jgi:hypothetical protein